MCLINCNCLNIGSRSVTKSYLPVVKSTLRAAEFFWIVIHCSHRYWVLLTMQRKKDASNKMALWKNPTYHYYIGIMSEYKNEGLFYFLQHHILKEKQDWGSCVILNRQNNMWLLLKLWSTKNIMLQSKQRRSDIIWHHHLAQMLLLFLSRFCFKKYLVEYREH